VTESQPASGHPRQRSSLPLRLVNRAFPRPVPIVSTAEGGFEINQVRSLLLWRRSIDPCKCAEGGT
jgi:hypothetical protein